MSIAPRTGSGAYFGIKKESSWNVPVVPDRFFPFLSESFGGGPEPSDGEGIYQNLLGPHEDATGLGNETYGGDIQMQLFDHGSALFAEACLGANATSGSNPYTHAATPGEPLPSYTIQFVMPDRATGGLRPKTYTGCKVASFEYGFEAGKIVTLGTTWSAAREILYRQVTDGVLTNADATFTSATAAFTADDVGKPISGTSIPSGTTILSLNSATSVEMSANATGAVNPATVVIGIAAASPSYASALIPVRAKNVTMSLFSSSVKIKSAKIRGDNKLTYDEDRFLGYTTIGNEQVSQEERVWDGDGMLQLVDNFGQYLRYKNGTLGALAIACTVGSNTVSFAQQIKLQGETPKVGGRGIVDQPLKWKAYGGTDAEMITITSVNADSAA